MPTQHAQAPPEFGARLHAAITERGFSVRQVVLRLPGSTATAMYRILAGSTRDPLTGTLLALCRAIDSDPDELLDAHRPVLEPEVEALLDAAEALAEEDRWLLVKVIRSITGRHGAHPLPSEASSGPPSIGSGGRCSRQYPSGPA